MFSKTFVSVSEHPFEEPEKGAGRVDPTRESYLASPVVLHGGGAGEAAADPGNSDPRQKAGVAGVEGRRRGPAVPQLGDRPGDRRRRERRGRARTPRA